MFISGLDLVDGTPLLDIKPYHPLDVVPPHQLRYPSWIPDVKGNGIRALNQVVISNDAETELRNRFEELREVKKSQHGGVGCFKFFDNVEAFCKVRNGATLDASWSSELYRLCRLLLSR